VKITLDYSRAPDLANFAQRVKATLEDWFPRVVRLLNSPNYSPPKEIKIFFDPNYKGVAMADWGKNLITGSVDYYRRNPNDVGSMYGTRNGSYNSALSKIRSVGDRRNCRLG